MISDEELRIAARECENFILDNLPEPESCEAESSPEFERRMKKLILRSDHPFHYWLQKSAACFLLVLLLGGGVLTFSTEARAAFFGWVREVYETYFEYHYVGEDQTAPEGIVYRPTWVPEGYEIVSETHGFSMSRIVYQNEEEKMIKFSYFANSEEADYRVRVDDATVQRVVVGNHPADLYIEHNEELSNVLVWADEEKGAIFDILATLSGDEMIKIAESVEAQKAR